MSRLAFLAAAAGVAAAVAPAAPAKTFRVDWREQKQVAGGAVKFRVTRIVVEPTRWAVTLAITNRTGDAVKLTTPPPGTTPIPHLSVGSKTQYRGETALVHTAASGYGWRAYDPPPSRLPASIAKGATWTGTISGRAKMLRGRYVVGFGWFEPQDPAAGGNGFYWVTDHSVTW